MLLDDRYIIKIILYLLAELVSERDTILTSRNLDYSRCTIKRRNKNLIIQYISNIVDLKITFKQNSFHIQ